MAVVWKILSENVVHPTSLSRRGEFPFSHSTSGTSTICFRLAALANQMLWFVPHGQNTAYGSHILILPASWLPFSQQSVYSAISNLLVLGYTTIIIFFFVFIVGDQRHECLSKWPDIQVHFGK